MLLNLIAKRYIIWSQIWTQMIILAFLLEFYRDAVWIGQSIRTKLTNGPFEIVEIVQFRN